MLYYIVYVLYSSRVIIVKSPMTNVYIFIILSYHIDIFTVSGLVPSHHVEGDSIILQHNIILEYHILLSARLLYTCYLSREL